MEAIAAIVIFVLMFALIILDKIPRQHSSSSLVYA